MRKSHVVHDNVCNGIVDVRSSGQTEEIMRGANLPLQVIGSSILLR